MPTPLRLPIRVLVKGPSIVNWTSWMGGPRTDFTFPRVIEEQLGARGMPSHVQAITMTSEQAKKLPLTWQREVLGFSPDVIVLSYGQFESVHLFLPRWLERHANSLRARQRPVSRFYRKTLVKPVWKSLAQVQSKVDARLKPSFKRSRVRTVPLDMETYIKHVQRVASPLVIVMEVLPPAERQRTWFPGMPARIALMNEANRSMVERVALPNVLWFTTSDLVERDFGGDLELATPDGFHYSPGLHRAIGEKLTDEIARWAATQPHLTTPGTTSAD
ncbi:MAG: hypothetical protein NTV23_09210 [Propionibacteriales bacterium]|nr:hypothetical protein [Propionibacteriales bacterium]